MTSKKPKQRLPRILKEDAGGIFVIDNYGNKQRPEWDEFTKLCGYSQCTAKAGDRLTFRFSHCRHTSQGFASDGSHWRSVFGEG